MVPVLMAGCLEIETTTRVNIDGSIERSVQLKGSASSLSGTRFNMPRHDLNSWQVTTDSLGDDRFLYHAVANFESVEKLNHSFEQNTQDPGVKIKASLVLDEGIFFKRYFYKENIWADLPGPNLSMDPYLSQAELEALLEHDVEGSDSTLDSLESVRLEHQWERFMKQLIYEDFLMELREGGQLSGHLEAIDGMLAEHSDSLLTILEKTNFYDENLVWKSILTRYVAASIIDDVDAANTHGFARFYESWQFFEDVLMDSYTFSVELPGVIQNTSTGNVDGHRMTWEPESIRLFFGGFSLEAESSKAKPGTMIFAGLLLLLIVILILAWSLRPKRGKQAV